jgi:hypothetical protein
VTLSSRPLRCLTTLGATILVSTLVSLAQVLPNTNRRTSEHSSQIPSRADDSAVKSGRSDQRIFKTVADIQDAAKRGVSESDLFSRLQSSPLLRQRMSGSDFVGLARKHVPLGILTSISNCGGVPELSTANLRTLLGANLNSEELDILLSSTDLSHVTFTSPELRATLSRQTPMILNVLSAWGTLPPVHNLQVPPRAPVPPTLKIRMAGGFSKNDITGGFFKKGSALHLEAVISGSSTPWQIARFMPYNYHVISIERSVLQVKQTVNPRIEHKYGPFDYYDSPRYLASEFLVSVSAGGWPRELVVPILVLTSSTGYPTIVDPQYWPGNYCRASDGVIVKGSSGAFFYTLPGPGQYLIQMKYQFTYGASPKTYGGTLKSNVLTLDIQ